MRIFLAPVFLAPDLVGYSDAKYNQIAMKTIDIGTAMPSLPELLALASNGNVILRAPDGKEFLLAEVDDLAMEVAMVSRQPELMDFLAHRSDAGQRSSLKQVRETLGLTGHPG